MSNQSDSEGISLKGFATASHGTEFAAYISALEAFDRLEQLRELKALGLEYTGIGPGSHVLEVGCGFGLETLRLAHLALPGGLVAGCDLSSDFLAEAQRRADAAGVNIAFRQARVETLPLPRPIVRDRMVGTPAYLCSRPTASGFRDASGAPQWRSRGQHRARHQHVDTQPG